MTLLTENKTDIAEKSATKRYSGLYIDSDIFRAYLRQHEFAEDDVLMPEQWVIAKAYPDAVPQAFRMHFFHESAGRSGISKEEWKQERPSKKFLARVYEIDPEASLKIYPIGMFAAGDIIGFSEESGQLSFVTETEARYAAGVESGEFVSAHKRKTEAKPS